jgi:hypothetical protein
MGHVAKLVLSGRKVEDVEVWSSPCGYWTQADPKVVGDLAKSCE